MRQASSQPRAPNLIVRISRPYVRVTMGIYLVLSLPTSWVAVDRLAADSFGLEKIQDAVSRDFACVLSSSYLGVSPVVLRSED